MPAPLLSTSQASYLLAGLIARPVPQRQDLRPLQAYRSIYLEPDVAPTAAASARITLGATQVTVAVTAQVAPVGESAEDDQTARPPGTGRVESHVQFSNSLQHSPLPPSITSLEVLGVSLSSLLSTFSTSLPSAELEIIKGQREWVLYLDAYVASIEGGNVEDALVLAAHAALYQLRIPRTRSIAFQPASGEKGVRGGHGGTGSAMAAAIGVTAEEAKDELGMKGAVGKSQRAVDFELLDSGYGGRTLSNRGNLPVSVSVYLLPDGGYVLDPSLAEQAVLPARVQVVANREGRIFSVQHFSGLAQALPNAVETKPEGGDKVVDAKKQVGQSPIGTDYRIVKTAVNIGIQYAVELASFVQERLVSEQDNEMAV